MLLHFQQYKKVGSLWLTFKVSTGIVPAGWEMAHQHKQHGQSALAPANGEDNGEQGREVFSRPVLCSTGRVLFTYPPTGFSHQNAADAIKMLSSLSLPSSSLLVDHFHGG